MLRNVDLQFFAEVRAEVVGDVSRSARVFLVHLMNKVLFLAHSGFVVTHHRPVRSPRRLRRRDCSKKKNQTSVIWGYIYLFLF